jgi:hypothetical protein
MSCAPELPGYNRAQVGLRLVRARWSAFSSGGKRLVPADDPAWSGVQQSLAHRFLHERADLRLFGGGQLL